MSDTWDEVAKEADLLRGAIITGTLRARHVELGPVDPAVPDSPQQRAARQRRAGQRADYRRRRKSTADQIRVEYGFQSPYPDVHETYCTGDVWDREQREGTVAELCNELHRLNPEKFTVEYLSERYGITPRSS